MPARYRVYVDWNADGDFTDPREEVSGRVLHDRSPLTIGYGRDQQRALSQTSSGEANFALNNISRDYSPENTASPLTGQVLPARSVLATATLGASTYTLLRGQIDDFKVRPSLDDRYVDVECIDALGQLKGVQVSTGLHRGLRTGEAVAVLLDAAGWSTTLRDLDPGATVMPFWWLNGDDAFQALLDLVDSEGPPALVTVDTSGRIVFRGRHHRLQNAASTTSQSTWRSKGIEPLISSPADYNHGWKEIVNSVTFDVPVRAVDGALSPVWTSQGLTPIASGETLEIAAQGSNPFLNAVVPAAGVDYTLVSGTVTMGLTRTSGVSTLITILATGGPALISDLQLRAYGVTTVNTVQVVAEDPSSIAKYGRRSLPEIRDPKWPSLGDAKAITTVILAQRSDRLSTMSVTMAAANNTRLTQQLTRNLSDRVRIVEGQTGMDADCYIEKIAHSIAQGGLEHTTTFGLEKTPSQIAGAFILGSATSGVLGTNKLGKRGFANPATMFVLGTQGVLGTNILSP